MILINILIFVLVIGTIILVHEMGHFIFAKRAGILCHEFSIGMGPVIYKKVKGETSYCIRAIPIGGYVSMAGEQVTSDIIKVGSIIGLNLKDGSVSEFILTPKRVSDVSGEVVNVELYSRYNEKLEITLNIDGSDVTYPVMEDAFYVFPNQTLQIAPYNRSFESKKVSHRFITILAGALMNFVLAIVIYLVCFFSSGIPNYDSNIVDEVSSGYPASTVLKSGDQITKIDAYEVESWNDVSTVMDKLAKTGISNIEVTFIRDNKEVVSNIKPYIVINSIGISNIQIDSSYESKVDGIMVGNLALNYKNKPGKDDIQLSNGDIITEIRLDNITKDGIIKGDFTPISTWEEAVSLMDSNDASKVYFKYYDQQTSKIQNTFDSGNVIESHGDELLNNQRIDKIVMIMGINPGYHFDFFGIIKASFNKFIEDFTLIFRTLKLLVNPSGVRQVGVENLSGFVGIFSMVSDIREQGFISLLLFMALLSVNIGVMNLLPIPALDGGRLVFLGYEAVTKKPLNRKIEATLNNVMFIVLMLLFVYVTFNDVMRLFG